MDLNKCTLGIVHANIITTRAMEPYIARYIPEVPVMHIVDDTIQRDNIAAGVGIIPRNNYFKFAQYTHNLEEAGVDMVLLACSTFNYAAELAQPMINIPILQIDRAMMEAAVKKGSRIGLLATLPTTIPSSQRLLELVAAEAGREIHVEVNLCSSAFEELSKGNKERHNEILLEAIDNLSQKNDAIVMAQLSMSALAPCLSNTHVPVFNSGDTGFERVREMLEKMGDQNGDRVLCRNDS